MDCAQQEAHVVCANLCPSAPSNLNAETKELWAMLALRGSRTTVLPLRTAGTATVKKHAKHSGQHGMDHKDAPLVNLELLPMPQ